MAKVTGVGGVFLRAQNAAFLREWYAHSLGLDFDGDGGLHFPDANAGAGLVLSLFARDSTYLGDPSTQSVMVNYVVDNLDEVAARLATLGVHVEEIQVESYGRFTWASDPEGNRFELWEPTAPSS